ncbi:MAG: aldehyde dehydrogenase family protein [Flavisolibacter sp.]
MLQSPRRSLTGYKKKDLIIWMLQLEELQRPMRRSTMHPILLLRALRVSRGIEAGNLSVNSHSSVRYSTPFGGFKQSGFGRELGPDALYSFTDEKNVFLATEG